MSRKRYMEKALAPLHAFDKAMFPVDTPKYKFWLARLFGKQVKARDGICTLYAYRWRGHTYVVGMEIHAEHTAS